MSIMCVFLRHDKKGRPFFSATVSETTLPKGRGPRIVRVRGKITETRQEVMDAAYRLHKANLLIWDKTATDLRSCILYGDTGVVHVIKKFGTIIIPR